MEDAISKFRWEMAKPQNYTGIEIHFTGFGNFGGIHENPTDILVSGLKKLLEDEPIPKVTLGTTCTVLVKTDDAIKVVCELEDKIKKNMKAKPNIKQVVVHLGVASSQSSFNIEAKGYNRKNFKDFPDNLTIINSIPYSYPLESIIPYKDITESLKGKGFTVSISEDPGSYLCNFIYYISLFKTDRKSVV